VDRLVKKQAGEAAKSRDGRLGLVEAGGSPGADGQPAKVPLRDVWVAVCAAITAKSPPADAMILDLDRLDQLPSRWPPSGGWMKGRRLARWNGAVDERAIPGWDTQATLQIGSGIADTFGIEHLPLYLGSNGVLYAAPRRPTPNGTLAEWQAGYRSADDVPGPWTAKWLPYGSYYPRQEVADAFASLAALHDFAGTVGGEEKPAAS
jgi:hypothetical protein